ESYAVRKPRPGKPLGLLNVMQELDQLESSCPYFLHLRTLFDGIEIVAHVVDTAAGGRDDVIESGEVAHEEGFGRGAVRVEAAVGHRLSAAGLVAWVHDLVVEPLEKLEGRDAHLRKE